MKNQSHSRAQALTAAALTPQYLGIWVLTLILKLILGAWIPVSPDEAYYWVWSHHPQWSYFDHPPMIAVVLGLGQIFETIGSAVRIPGLILGHFTLGLWMLILKDRFSKNQMIAFVFLFLTTPLIGPGSLIMTPDLPFLFFLTAAVYFFLQWEKKPKITDALLMGVALGFAFCSKYTAVLFVPCAIWILIWNKEVKHLKISNALIFSIGFLIAAFPVIYWNLQNDFISFRFQMDHGLGKEVYEWQNTAEYLLAQVFMLFPFVLWRAFNKKPKASDRWMYAFSILPLGFFFLATFRKGSEANWPLMAHPFVMALAVSHSGEKLKGLYRVGIFWLVCIAVVLSELFFLWMPKETYKKTDEIRQFDPVVEYLKGHQGQTVYARNYQMASMLSFGLKTQIYKLKGFNRVDFYDFLDQSTPKDSDYRLVILNDDVLPKWILDRGDQIVEKNPIEGTKFIVLTLHRGGN